MKKILFLITIFVFQNLCAQLTINIGKNVYYQAKIELEDGTMKEGYILNFDDKSALYYNTSDFQLLFGSPENNSGLSKEFYTFKKNEEDDDEKIPISEIKRITVEEPEFYSGKLNSTVYEKVKIAKPTNDLEINKKEKSVLLPIYYSNAKLTVYNFTELLCKNNSRGSCNIKGYNYYFLPTNAEYAIKPFEITAGTMFTMKKIGPKIYSSFEFMGRDCPLYLEHLKGRRSKYDEAFGKTVNKEFNKSLKVKQAEYGEDLKKAKKSMSKEDFVKYEFDRKSKLEEEQNKMFFDSLFNEEVMDYINSCE